MCKSRAEGGERCEPHTRAAVTTGMASYAAAVTPVSKSESKQVLADLQREGHGLPSPTREEVDSFLETTITGVRHDESIDPSLRERIVTRLHAAIGKVLPDGPTFHAWKNAIAESLRRSQRAATAGFVAGILTFSGGCGLTGGGDSDPAASASAPTPTVTAGAKGLEYQQAQLPEPKFTAGAVGRYGEEELRGVYDQALDYVTEHQYSDFITIQVDDAKPQDFKSATDLMTKRARDDFNRSIVKGRTNPEERKDAASFAYYGLPETDTVDGATVPVKVRDDVPSAVFNKKVTDPRVSLRNDGRLVVRMDYYGEVRVSVGEDKQRLPFEARMELLYEQVGGKWLIDGWYQQARPTHKAQKDTF